MGRKGSFKQQSRSDAHQAAAEGVADRVEEETGDITRPPFADASFDVVVSMTVAHNIPSRDSLKQALRELVRVLEPGGRIAIFDLLHVSRYRSVAGQACRRHLPAIPEPVPSDIRPRGVCPL